MTKVVSQVRSVDGDPEDINYLMCARAIEQQLTDAVQNEPKLVIANAKIASLEKVWQSSDLYASVDNVFSVHSSNPLHQIYFSTESRITFKRDSHAKFSHIGIGESHYQVFIE